MFGISGFELLILMVLVLIFFGPDKLPELGRTIGRALGTFKRAQEDMERVIRAEMYASEAKPKIPTEAAPAAAAEQKTPAASIYAATADEDDEEEEE